MSETQIELKDYNIKIYLGFNIIKISFKRCDEQLSGSRVNVARACLYFKNSLLYSLYITLVKIKYIRKKGIK